MRSRLAVSLILACVLITAPAAMACEKCQFSTSGVSCVETLRGWAVCQVIDVNWCNISIPCGSALTEPEPLAADYVVASVERLDEPAPAVPVVASVERNRETHRVAGLLD